MVNKNRKNIEKAIFSSRIIPLIDNKNLEFSTKQCEIVVKSGCKIIEFGLRHEKSIEHYEFLFQYMKNKFSDIFFGVGSVTDQETAKQVIRIGVDFIVGPGLNEKIAKECKKNSIYYIPGCATVSEILKARELGCELIKIFPAMQLGGEDFLKSIMAPLPWLKAIPAGGIHADTDTINKWINAGAQAVTIGSSIFKKEFNDLNSLQNEEKDFKKLLEELSKKK